MKAYLSVFLMLVVFADTAVSHIQASERVPPQPEMMSPGPVISLPPHYAYATRLLHLYNAQVNNANYRIPPIHEIMTDSKRGLQAWLSTIPDVSVFDDEAGYALYQSSGDAEGTGSVYVLFLPNSRGSFIEQEIQERLQRFIRYQCLADGFPLPRIGKVNRSDYQRAQSGSHSDQSWIAALCAGILSALVIILLLRLRR